MSSCIDCGQTPLLLLYYRVQLTPRVVREWWSCVPCAKRYRQGER